MKTIMRNHIAIKPSGLGESLRSVGLGVLVWGQQIREQQMQRFYASHRWILGPILLAITGLPTPAESSLIVGEYTRITSGTFVVSGEDLLQTNLSSASGEDDAGARNGNFPLDVSVLENSAANPIGSVWSGPTIYILDGAFDIKEINVYSAWDTLRTEQGYQLYTSVNGGTDWSLLGTVSTPDITDAASGVRTRNYDDSGSAIATGVNAVRFDFFNPPGSSGTFYREFDVIALAVPEASEALVVLVGMTGLVVGRRRKRRA